jgi:hypothetical protein
MEKRTKSSEQVSRKSLKGKTLVKTDCSPVSFALLREEVHLKETFVDFLWTSMRFGSAI